MKSHWLRFLLFVFAVALTPVSSWAQAGLTASARIVSFEDRAVKSTSAPQFVTITNSGKSELKLSQVASDSEDFTLLHNCALAPEVMAPGASCSISIRFTPSAIGSRDGNLTIKLADDPVEALSIPLQGNGVASSVELSQTYLTFRTLLVGLSSMPQFVQVTNHSRTESVKISAISVSTDFSLSKITSPCVPGESLPPQASCRLAVVWTPSDSGPRSGQIRIVDSDAASPHVIGLYAIATGVRLSASRLKWTPTALGVSSEAQTVEIRNEGKAAISIRRLDTVGDFSQENTCGTKLMPREGCVVTVRFRPTAAGSRDGTVSIYDSDATGVQQVFLTAAGSWLDVSPLTVNFADQATSGTSPPEAVILANRGTDAVQIAAVNVRGDFVIPSKTCGEKLTSGQSCRINVSFAPTASGVRTGTLSVETGAGALPQQVTLSGKGR